MKRVAAKVRTSVKKRVSDDARFIWRKWSVRFNALGLLIMGWVFFDPTAVLTIYNMMPAEVRGRVPDHVASTISFILFGLAILSRLVKQKDRTNDDA